MQFMRAKVLAASLGALIVVIATLMATAVTSSAAPVSGDLPCFECVNQDCSFFQHRDREPETEDPWSKGGDPFREACGSYTCIVHGDCAAKFADARLDMKAEVAKVALAAKGNSTEVLTAALLAFPGKLTVNSQRQAVQIQGGCNGTLIANLPLSPTQVANLLSEDRTRGLVQ